MARELSLDVRFAARFLSGSTPDLEQETWDAAVRGDHQPRDGGRTRRQTAGWSGGVVRTRATGPGRGRSRGILKDSDVPLYSNGAAAAIDAVAQDSIQVARGDSPSRRGSDWSAAHGSGPSMSALTDLGQPDSGAYSLEPRAELLVSSLVSRLRHP